MAGSDEITQQSFTYEIFEPLVTKKYRKEKLALVFLLCTGLIGIIWVALLASLDQLAEAAGSSAKKSSYLLYAKGSGAIISAIFTPQLLDRFDRHNVLTIVILLYTILLVLLAFNSSLILLYVYYFLFGVVAITIDSGAIVGIIKLFNEGAGPWIGSGSQISIFLYASIAEGVRILVDDDIEKEFLSFTVFPIIAMIFLQLTSSNGILQGHQFELGNRSENPETIRLISEENETDFERKPNEEGKHYYAEILICIGLMFYTGGISFFVTYFSTYLKESNIMDSEEGDYLLLNAFVLAFFGKIVLLFDQIYLIDIKCLPMQIILISIITTIVGLFELIDTNAVTLWVAISFIAFFGTNIPALLFDMLNRVTNATAISVTIAYAGAILGESFVPPLFLMLWEVLPTNMFSLLLVFAHFIQIPIVLGVLSVSYHPSVMNTKAKEFLSFYKV